MQSHGLAAITGIERSSRSAVASFMSVTENILGGPSVLPQVVEIGGVHRRAIRHMTGADRDLKYKPTYDGHRRERAVARTDIM